MKLHALAWGPLACASATLALLAIPNAAPRATALEAANETGKLIALTGCAAAAMAFDRGDYLRRGWEQQALCFLLLLVRDLVFRAPPDAAHALGASALAWRATLLGLANIAGLVSVWTLARVYDFSGLGDGDGDRGRRRSLTALAAVLAALVTGASLYSDCGAVARGDHLALGYVLSDVSDAGSFVLLAPVVLTAVALRGGRLVWPWALLTAGFAAWMVFDAITATAWLAHLDGVGWTVSSEAFRVFACSSIGAAGIAQRTVLRAPA